MIDVALQAPSIMRLEGGLRTQGMFNNKSSPGKPLVTVVTVVRNGKEHIEEAIQSVLSQAYDNIEYIIVDGGSTDGTIEIIKKYDDQVAYWISEPDHGIYDAMNKGILLARGELIGLLNSDDFYEKQAIQFVVNTYSSRGSNQPVIVYGNFYILDEELGLKTDFLSNLNYRQGMTICHQAMFVHKNIYLDLFLYDLTYKLAADYDFFIKAINHNVTFLNTDKFLVNFRNVGATYNSVNPMYKETLSIIKKHFGYFSSQYFLLLLRVGKVIVQTTAKLIIEVFLGKKILKKVKIIQNKLLRKTWHDIAN